MATRISPGLNLSSNSQHDASPYRRPIPTTSTSTTISSAITNTPSQSQTSTGLLTRCSAMKLNHPNTSALVPPIHPQSQLSELPQKPLATCKNSRVSSQPRNLSEQRLHTTSSGSPSLLCSSGLTAILRAGSSRSSTSFSATPSKSKHQHQQIHQPQLDDDQSPSASTESDLINTSQMKAKQQQQQQQQQQLSSQHLFAQRSQQASSTPQNMNASTSTPIKVQQLLNLKENLSMQPPYQKSSTCSTSTSSAKTLQTNPSFSPNMKSLYSNVLNSSWKVNMAQVTQTPGKPTQQQQQQQQQLYQAGLNPTTSANLPRSFSKNQSTPQQSQQQLQQPKQSEYPMASKQLSFTQRLQSSGSANGSRGIEISENFTVHDDSQTGQFFEEPHTNQGLSPHQWSQYSAHNFNQSKQLPQQQQLTQQQQQYQQQSSSPDSSEELKRLRMEIEQFKSREIKYLVRIANLEKQAKKLVISESESTNQSQHHNVSNAIATKTPTGTCSGCSYEVKYKALREQHKSLLHECVKQQTEAAELASETAVMKSLLFNQSHSQSELNQQQRNRLLVNQQILPQQTAAATSSSIFKALQLAHSLKK